jgi:HEAT repeat protein
MSVDKQLLNYHINRLRNKSRDVRLMAVEELKHLGDLAALEPLQDVFQHDDDPEVRKAAQEAGRVIFLNNRDSTA